MARLCRGVARVCERRGEDQGKIQTCFISHAKVFRFYAEGNRDQPKAFKHGVMNKVVF